METQFILSSKVTFAGLWAQMTPAERRMVRRELESDALQNIQVGSMAQRRAGARKLADRAMSLALQGTHSNGAWCDAPTHYPNGCPVLSEGPQKDDL